SLASDDASSPVFAAASCVLSYVAPPQAASAPRVATERIAARRGRKVEATTVPPGARGMPSPERGMSNGYATVNWASLCQAHDGGRGTADPTRRDRVNDTW